MSTFFPARDAQPGSHSKWPARFLVVYGALLTGPGLLHLFLPDGGAGTIGGIDLSRDFATIRAMIAWAGAMQVANGLACMAIGLRWQSLVPLFLALALLERSLMAWSAWFAHVSPSGHHPPGHFGHLVALPVLGLFLWLSLRPGRGAD